MDRQALLEAEAIINLTTVKRVEDWMGNSPNADVAVSNLIAKVSRDAMVGLMKRALKSSARTEYFDIAEDQQEIFVLGSPIDTGETITLVNNISSPRDWTVTAISSDYVITDPERAERGVIYVDQDLDYGANAMKVTYTGGMATRTCLSGTNGATAASGVFTSSGATFSTDEVAAGDALIIYDDADNRGEYAVSSVTDETTLVVTPTFSNESATSQIYEVYTQSCMCRYRDVALAADMQVEYLWRRRGNTGVRSEGIVGANIVWYNGKPWVEDALVTLQQYARGV